VFKLSPDGALTTFAGTVDDNGDVEGFAGDGGPATAAKLAGAGGVAVDAQGNVYIADGGNNRVRKVGLDGVITTVAGSGDGHPGFSGDGGPAVSARLAKPSDVAVDRNGNLYIADFAHIGAENSVRIRKVTPGGTITTIAGTGKRGYCDNTGDGGPATKAGLWAGRMAVDRSGNVYLASGAVRKISPAGTITTIVRQHGYYPGGPRGCTTKRGIWVPANSGLASKAHVDARGIAVDGSGSLYITDGYLGQNRVLKIG
jgi:hypothetical protein